MRVSYEGFEEEASDLFAAIESRHKGKGVAGRELNLSSSMNYDSKRNPTKPRPSSCYHGNTPIPL